MIRFKVVRASKLLLWLAVVLLIAVVGFIAVQYAAREADPERQSASVSLVSRTEDEAGSIAAFASSDVHNTIEVEVVEEARQTAKPSVLIYHTHTHEAYEQDSEDPYIAVEAWRTDDADHSVVRVGEELALQLRAYGFEVIHDTTDHENDALSTAYTRSLATLEGYTRVFDLYIDLHRDAYSSGMQRRYEGEDGIVCAQPMILIGNGNGFDVKPHFNENLMFANLLTERMNKAHPGICKPVLVKDGRYNQHIGVFSILIEVGHNRNTLQEALDAVPAIAQAIESVMISRPTEDILPYLKYMEH